MPINLLYFLLLFLPIGVLVYRWLLGFKNKNISKYWLVLWSVFSFAFGNYIALLAIITSCCINFILANKLQKSNSNKFIFTLSIVINICILAVYKYHSNLFQVYNFLTGDKITDCLATSLSISFLTFLQINYLTQIYRNRIVKLSALEYLLNVTFLPKIIGFVSFETKNNISNILPENTAKGLFMLIIGLFKKVIIANTFAIWADAGFSQQTVSLNIIQAWVTSLSFTFQIYFDVTALLDISVGIALLFGFQYNINYFAPYKSSSIIEFWNRWYISLVNFFKQSVLIPIKGTKNRIFPAFIALSSLFLIVSVWHGLKLTLLIWGFLNVFGISVSVIWNKVKKLPNWLAWLLTFNFLNISWVFFRAENLKSAKTVIAGMLNLPNLFQYYNEFYILWAVKASFITGLFFIGSFYFVLKAKPAEHYFANFQPTKKMLILSILLIVLVLVFYNNNSFIYNGF